MLTIGITGGQATGKSLVTRLLQAQGAVTFSADEAARAILDPRLPTLRAITKVFGTKVLSADGNLNRACLAELIFADSQARAVLNQITHPPILRLLHAQIDACRLDLSPTTVVAVEVPLLFETKMQAWFERIVVVSASETMQASRLAARNLLSEVDARRRLSAQMPLADKVALADDIIVNDGSIAAVDQAVKTLWQDLQKMLAFHGPLCYNPNLAGNASETGKPTDRKG